MDDQNTQINNKQEKKWFLGPKIIFVILGAVLLVEVIYAALTLSNPGQALPPAASTPQIVSMVLFSSRNQYKTGETVPVLVQVDTGSRATDGVDLVLNFDPKALEASAGAIVKGAIYPEYPQMKIDAKIGQIQISGISGLQGRSFTGQGTFASINFKAKAAGDTSLTINFSPGKTDDSNAVEALSGNDILENVSDLTLTVQ